MWALCMQVVFVVEGGVEESDGRGMCRVGLEKIGRVVEKCKVVLQVGAVCRLSQIASVECL